MKKTIGVLLKALAVIIVVAWMGLILIEYFRYKDNEPMLVVLKEETLTYDDGTVDVSWGLGYKSITYNRTSIYGKAFGHVFTKVKDELPEK